MKPFRQIGERAGVLAGATSSAGRSAALYLVLFLCLPACATRPPRPPHIGSVQDPYELLQILSSRADSLRDLDARARISLRIDGVREQRASAYLLYRSPGDLKLAVGTLGIEIMSALARHDSLAVYLPRDNHYLEGSPSEVLYSITGVNLEYYDVHRAILGLPGLSPLDLPRMTRFEIQDEQIFLEIRTPLWDRRIWLDRRTATLLEERIYDRQGNRLSSRRLGDYRDENGVILPRRIEIFQGEDQIQIRVSRRKINTGISDDRFRMRVPADVVRLGSPGSL